MRLVLDNPGGVAEWVAERIPQMTDAADFGPMWAIGVESDDGTALGGVVYHNHLPRFRNIELSFAAATPRWLTPNMVRGLMAYPFDQLECARVTTMTPKKNREARHFIDRFGFKREGVVRKGFGDDDMIVSGLMAWEWRLSKWARSANPLTVPDAA